MKTISSKKSFYVVLIAAIIIMTILTFFLYFSSDSLNDLSSFTAIFSFILVFVIYFGNQYKKESDETKKEYEERKHVSETLCAEMLLVLNFFKASKNSSIRKIAMTGLIIRDNKIPNVVFSYVNHSIASDMYDSFKFSGKLSLINYKFHSRIQSIFLTLRLYDKYLDRINIIEDNMDLHLGIYNARDNAFKMKTYRYYKKLHDYEDDLFILIPCMVRNLKKEFNIKC